jgi:hypothetical protein
VTSSGHTGFLWSSNFCKKNLLASDHTANWEEVIGTHFIWCHLSQPLQWTHSVSSSQCLLHKNMKVWYDETLEHFLLECKLFYAPHSEHLSIISDILASFSDISFDNLDSEIKVQMITDCTKLRSISIRLSRIVEF